MVFRVDIGSILRPVKYLADGGARVDATLTRTGVFIYPDGKGGVIREYRPESEVFDAESMASFEALPVTDDHPTVMVDSGNVGQYKRGRTGDTIKRDGIHMVGALIVDDPELVGKMRAGKRDVSNGYTCELDMTPGVSPEGEPYDAVQRKIRGNHTAIVDVGRAGTARARMDTMNLINGAPALPPAPVNDTEASPETARADAKQRILDMEELQKKLGEALAQAAAEKVRADKAEADAKTARDSSAKAEAERDNQKARADKAEAERDDAVASVPVRAKERAGLIARASHVLGGADAKIGDVAIVDAADRAIKLAVIKKVDGVDVDKDGAGQSRPDVYVSARFDGAIERADKGSQSFGALQHLVNQRVNDTSGDPLAREREARAKMIRDSAGAHKTTVKE